jgi:hypothetical protein
MGQKSGPVKEPAEQLVKAIRRATRRQFSAEEKIGIVLAGLRGENSIAELCRREGIGRGQGSAPGGQRVEGGGRRTHAREPAAEKKYARGWGGRRMRYPASGKCRSSGWSSSPRCRCVDLPPETWTPGYAAFASACSGVM